MSSALEAKDGAKCVCFGSGWGGEEPTTICPIYVAHDCKLYDLGRVELCLHCGHDAACHAQPAN